jgi:hypothetical protein
LGIQRLLAPLRPGFALPSLAIASRCRDRQPHEETSATVSASGDLDRATMRGDDFVHRAVNVPYFAGHGGVTSPDGYTTTAVPNGWTPDLRKSETHLIASMLFRM